MKDIHPAATPHLPGFITAPGETDVFLGVAAFMVIAAVFGFGLLFLWLHSLPERMAHKSHKLQMELVAALGLLSLFTHVHLFWVAALVLALVKLPEIHVPDLAGPLHRIADAITASKPASRIAGKPDTTVQTEPATIKVTAAGQLSGVKS